MRQRIAAVAAAVGVFLYCSGPLPPPPVPSPPPSPPPLPGLRFFALGDGGTGGDDQFRVARAVRGKCAVSRCDFGLLLGDNIYSDGVGSAQDPQWSAKFERPHAELLGAGLPFQAVLGNHDYADGSDWSRGAHQVGYGRLNPLWRMPAEHYLFTSGPATFVALDTTTIVAARPGAEDAQAALVQGAIAGNQLPWVIALGHHPYRSNGPNGSAGARLGAFIEGHLCGKVDLYLAAHDHNLQVLPSSSSCPMLQVVAGGGGYATYALPGSNPSHFQVESLGFAYVTVETTRITVEMVGVDGTVLYTHTLAKVSSPAAHPL